MFFNSEWVSFFACVIVTLVCLKELLHILKFPHNPTDVVEFLKEQATASDDDVLSDEMRHSGKEFVEKCKESPELEKPLGITLTIVIWGLTIVYSAGILLFGNRAISLFKVMMGD